jgi:hypothetical protein
MIMQRWNILLACLLVLAFAALATACPNCKDTIANTESAGSPGVSSAFNTSIYVMLGAFLGVLGLVAGVIIKGIRAEIRFPNPQNPNQMPNSIVHE